MRGIAGKSGEFYKPYLGDSVISSGKELLNEMRAGQGANMALLDAEELANELVNGGHSNAQEAIKHFAEMAPQRSVDAVGLSRRNIALAHSEGWKKQLLLGFLGSIGGVMLMVQKTRSLLRG